MKKLTNEIRDCRVCAEHLELGPRPVFAAHPKSRIVVIGQAPGSVVHRTGVPWDDKSGENLRKWMGIGDAIFYDETKIALIPMGFCYPGKGKTGDLPPRKECAPLWHDQLLNEMNDIQLTLLIGKYAQDYYLGDKAERTLTDTVRNHSKYLPNYFVLPHPSPRNNIWQAKNKWFGEGILPNLKYEVSRILN